MTKINFQNLDEFSNRQLPLHRIFEGKKHYDAEDVAKNFDITTLLNAVLCATILLAKEAFRSQGTASNILCSNPTKEVSFLMDGSHDSKGSTKNQAINYQSNEISTQTSYPCTYKGQWYLGAKDVAKIVGVARKTVWKWHSQGLFFADIKTHDGYLLYEVERVMQLKSVYHKNWMRGGYQPSPTTTAVAPEPTVNPTTISRDDIDGYDEPDIYDDSADHDEPKPVKADFPAPHLVIVKKPNVQIYPSKTRIEPNDKHNKTFFSLSDDKYMQLVEGKRTRQITEMSSHKKFGEILTPYQIINQAGYINHSPLDQFDRAVLSVCVSEYYAGNHYTTPAIIYRALTGKVNKMTDAMPSKNQLSAILNRTVSSSSWALLSTLTKPM
ncbi:MAG: hypothetical protein IJQ82_03905 [Selenomonadaceae bacterium]|nr:hypothetical protein [Selenomonadaceae bacterium]